ncbi:MAG: helix-turn-helix domain-containing protein [Clostridiales bacterium]|jgi:transcriptional regulator with XRE-family HTH domain|nr:helix-turn-helix domain-containing protein [Clostridiales bacterium]
MSFANNLKTIMQEQKLNQTDLSNLTGIGKPSLSQYLSGRHLPYQNRIAQIAAALGVSPGRLTTRNPNGECEPPPPPSHQKVTIEEAARRLGKSQQFVRVALQNGVAPFGFATKGSGSTYDYHISPKLLDEYIGERS